MTKEMQPSTLASGKIDLAKGLICLIFSAELWEKFFLHCRARMTCKAIQVALGFHHS